MSSLEEKSAKWLRNKKELGFSARVLFAGTSMSVLIENAPRKYLKAVKELAGEMILDGLKEMGKAFAYPVASEDAESEGKRVREFLEGRKDSLLNLLLKEGYPSFSENVKQDAAILKAKYEIDTLTRSKEGWMRWDGAILTKKGWTSPDGSVNKEIVSDFINENFLNQENA